MRSILLRKALVVWISILLGGIPTSNGLKGNLKRKLHLQKAQPDPEVPLTTLPPVPQTIVAVISQRMGGTVRTVKYNNNLYVGSNGGPVSTGDDLECNFEGYCCWDNVGSPTDQFDWSHATGQPDSATFEKNFGTSRKPTGRYLVAAQPRSSATKEAMFTSCTVSCTTRPIKVQFRHWTTEGVLLQVCSSETFFNENNKVQLINCKDVKRNTSPGLSTVTIPPGDFLDIIFVASNFQNERGGIAIIDDITVDVTPCRDKPEGKVPPAARHQS